ncbi:MAG: EndoU domain-containing protein [Flavobacteriaceae bacterium]
MRAAPGRSTVFPTSWSRQRVMHEARKAFEKATRTGEKKWKGVSPSGVEIEFTREPNGEINSFYPLL